MSAVEIKTLVKIVQYNIISITIMILGKINGPESLMMAD